MNLINTSRRTLLKSIAAVSVLAVVPTRLFAEWPMKAFKANKVDDAITALYGNKGEASDKVMLKAPDIAENGAVVPISVSTDIEGVDNISIYVENNPNPLAIDFEIGENVVADVSTRIKMGKTSLVFAAVKAGDKVYTTSKEVKVTIGGCGG